MSLGIWHSVDCVRLGAQPQRLVVHGWSFMKTQRGAPFGQTQTMPLGHTVLGMHGSNPAGMHACYVCPCVETKRVVLIMCFHQETLSGLVRQSYDQAVSSEPLKPLFKGGAMRALAAAFDADAYAATVATASDLVTDTVAARAWLEALAALPGHVCFGPLVFEVGEPTGRLVPLAAAAVR